jgi:hypothetical protein
MKRRVDAYVMSRGYRSGDLALLSVAWVVLGFGIIVQGDPDPGHKVPIEYLGTPIRVGIWWVCAAAGIAAAARRPEHDDRWGFGFMIVPPALRAISYTVAWAQGVLGLSGQTSLWPDAVVWTAVTIFVYRLARRPDMPHRVEGGDYGHHPGGEYGHPGLGRRRGEG